MNDDDAVPRRGREDSPEPSGDAGAARAPASKPAPRPARAASRVPRPLRWLLDDLGLKLLALVLAVSTWALVRNTQLKTTESIADVAVEIESTPSDIRLYPDGPRVTQLTLEGTTGAVQRARTELDRAGRKIKLRVHDLTGNDRTTPFSSVDDFAYPFEAKHLVKSIDVPVNVRWTRLESIEIPMQQLAPPEVRTGGGYFEPATGFPAFDTPKATITVTGPVAQIRRLRDEPNSLFPDAVDAQDWLKLNPDLTTLFPWTSSFSQWRATDPAQRSESLLSITPASVSGKLKVRESKADSLKSDFAILYPPGVAPSAYDGFDVKILDTGYDARTRKLDISIKGDASLVGDRKNANGAWTLVVVLPAPPADGGPDLENVTADVRLVPPPDDPASVEAKPRLRLVGPTKLFVSITRKKS